MGLFGNFQVMPDQEIPRATKGVLALVGEDASGCDSPSLRMSKMASAQRIKISNLEELRAIVDCQKRVKTELFPVEHPQAKVIYARLQERMLINLNDGLLENAGTSLHRHFGQPFIPGSAVKGIARVAAKESVKEHPEQQKLLDDVFGREDRSDGGKVSFLAAIPVGCAHLEVDVLAPHHMKYYWKARQYLQAYDSEEPMTVFFLAIPKNTEFCFTLIPLQGRTDLLEPATLWLITALTQHGVGARTSAGYGWFVETTEEHRARVAEEAARRAQSKTLSEEREHLETERTASFIEAFQLPGLRAKKLQSLEGLPGFNSQEENKSGKIGG